MKSGDNTYRARKKAAREVMLQIDGSLLFSNMGTNLAAR